MAISSIEINGVVAAGAGAAASGGAAGGGAAAVGGGAGSSSVITSRGVGGGGCGSGSFSFGRGVDTGVADGVEEVDAPADRLLFLLRRRFIKRVGRDTTPSKLPTFFGERHHEHFRFNQSLHLRPPRLALFDEGHILHNTRGWQRRGCLSMLSLRVEPLVRERLLRLGPLLRLLV